MSIHGLIKTRTKCVCIKPEVKRDDSTAITTTTYQSSIGWLDENCYLMGKEWHVW